MDNFTSLHYAGRKQQSNLTCLSPHVNHPKEMKEIPSKTKAPDKISEFRTKVTATKLICILTAVDSR